MLFVRVLRKYSWWKFWMENFSIKNVYRIHRNTWTVMKFLPAAFLIYSSGIIYKFIHKSKFQLSRFSLEIFSAPWVPRNNVILFMILGYIKFRACLVTKRTSYRCIVSLWVLVSEFHQPLKTQRWKNGEYFTPSNLRFWH